MVENTKNVKIKNAKHNQNALKFVFKKINAWNFI